MDESDILIRFGERIRTLRKQKGLSQEALGLETDLEQTYISDIERGARNISLRNIYAIADALGVTLSQLFDGL